MKNAYTVKIKLKKNNSTMLVISGQTQIKSQMRIHKSKKNEH